MSNLSHSSDPTASKPRIEHDLVGYLEIPQDAYYGIHSLRAKHNFPISGQKMHPELIKSLTMIKKAAALANAESGQLSPDCRDAIVQACDEVLASLAGDPNIDPALSSQLQDAFIVDAIQGGAGTSANMNTNEVIANRANEILGGERGQYDRVHPNNHVNMSQSTNDVYPTAGRIAALHLIQTTIHQLLELIDSLEKRAAAFDHIVKVGRTEMQDAAPMRLGQSFQVFALALKRDLTRIQQAQEALSYTNMGGTVIGTGLNASSIYIDCIHRHLSEVSGLKLQPYESLMDGTSNLDAFVQCSSALKTAAVNISKLSNDLRLMSSGPFAGLSEIHLPSRQNGSSIVPGKVNPVIPEVVSQIAYAVIGNDLTITLSAEAGQLELNAFEPILFHRLFESISYLGQGAHILSHHCIDGIEANESAIQAQLAHSLVLVTALSPRIGYAKASELAQKALSEHRPLRDLVEEELDLTTEELDELFDAKKLTYVPRRKQCE